MSMTVYIGLGLPMEPGFGVMPMKLPTVSVVSVWPKPSMMEMPVASRKRVKTSGFMASPAMLAWRMEERSYLERSSLMKYRYMVGGAQNVVIWYFAKSGRMSSAWKRSKS